MICSLALYRQVYLVQSSARRGCRQKNSRSSFKKCNLGRFPFSQNFQNFRFGGKRNTFRRFVPLEYSQKQWKIQKGGPVFPVGISERNVVFHLRFSQFVPVPGPRSDTATCRGLRPNGTTFVFPKWKAPDKLYFSVRSSSWPCNDY